MNKIAFIGVGIMGRSMVRNLMKAGFELHIYARTRSKVEDVISEGATFHDAIADCVKDAEAVITIVCFQLCSYRRSQSCRQRQQLRSPAERHV